MFFSSQLFHGFASHTQKYSKSRVWHFKLYNLVPVTSQPSFHPALPHSIQSGYSRLLSTVAHTTCVSFSVTLHLLPPYIQVSAQGNPKEAIPQLFYILLYPLRLY